MTQMQTMGQPKRELQFAVTEEGRILETDSCDGKIAGYAQFSLAEDDTVVLMRWPRNADAAYLPEVVGGYSVTGIAPLAFAAFHFPEELWSQFGGGSSLSFSVFCIMHAGAMQREALDTGGPVTVQLPDTVQAIGMYAFWHCDRLTEARLPAHLERLEIGLFGECSRLARVQLPQDLGKIGKIYPDNVHVMPDVGVFSGCHGLKELTIPRNVTEIGAESFNSCGLVHLRVEDEEAGDRAWSRDIQTHPLAFDHTAALQWMSRCVNGKIVRQIGLPAARDKILTCDKRYRIIVGLPRLFLTETAEQMDRIAVDAFRLDFSGRMAIARLRYPEHLSMDMRKWYLNLLVEYSDRLEKFWPCEENREKQLLELLQACEGFDALLLGRLMEIAGRSHMQPELIYEMMELRNRRFLGITGMECLEL